MLSIQPHGGVEATGPPPSSHPTQTSRGYERHFSVDELFQGMYLAGMGTWKCSQNIAGHSRWFFGNKLDVFMDHMSSGTGFKGWVCRL